MTKKLCGAKIINMLIIKADITFKKDLARIT